MKALLTFVKACIGRLPELFTDPKDGTLSHTRIGMIIAGAAFTFKMVHDMPDDPLLWLTYLGTVGSYAVARQAVSQRMGSNNAGQ